MKNAILFSIIPAAAMLLSACTSTVSQGVKADGSVDKLVWPTQKESWRDEALRLPSPSIAAVRVGLDRKNVYALLDVPHFSEIRGAREWNYILQRPEYTRENQAVCHLKLIYNDDNHVAAMYWLPEDCATVYHDKKPYRLSADALFAFDTATLRADADHALADLLQKVRASGDDNTIRIDGYTDRLGSSEYNHKLSQARAETVRQYLISGGIDAKRISAVGHGEENPLSHCDNHVSRDALISCLQPDRRVEVSVSGIHY
ncbi:MAG: OmpA family protein [Cardiobacteriaceae bacterium]|nr:OmpA family protein [Cardiobacteriaceae bacterium]